MIRRCGHRLRLDVASPKAITFPWTATPALRSEEPVGRVAARGGGVLRVHVVVGDDDVVAVLHVHGDAGARADLAPLDRHAGPLVDLHAGPGGRSDVQARERRRCSSRRGSRAPTARAAWRACRPCSTSLRRRRCPPFPRRRPTRRSRRCPCSLVLAVSCVPTAPRPDVQAAELAAQPED